MPGRWFKGAFGIEYAKEMFCGKITKAFQKTKRLPARLEIVFDGDKNKYIVHSLRDVQPYVVAED